MTGLNDNQQPEPVADVVKRENMQLKELLQFETDMLLCPVCDGTGADDPNFDGWDDEGWLPCEACNGTGMIGIK